MRLLLATHSAFCGNTGLQASDGFCGLVWLAGGSLFQFMNELVNVLILSFLSDVHHAPNYKWIK